MGEPVTAVMSGLTLDPCQSEIVVVFDTEDTKKAKDFMASADLKEAMENAGVPTIYLLEAID